MKRQEAAKVEQARIAAEEEAKRPKCVRPAQGSFTSGFGARWGTSHNGVDIANAIGTPIVSVMDGTVVEAGPASGFGLWVRVQHEDGTITVYGHMNTIDVRRAPRSRPGSRSRRSATAASRPGRTCTSRCGRLAGRRSTPSAGWPSAAFLSL